jgi:L-2,4-diaminobutyrate decarboxylase
MLAGSGAARLSGPVDTNIVCFRPKAPRGVEELQRILARDAGVCVTAPTYRGESWLKAVILNPFTTAADLGRLVDTFSFHCPG